MLEVKFVFTKPFMRQWDKNGLQPKHLRELMKQINEYLKFAPDNNFGRKFPVNIIEETGGAIKYRFRPSDGQKGESGSFRIIYFVYNGDRQELVFLNVYAKKDKANLTKREKFVIKQLIDEITKD